MLFFLFSPYKDYSAVIEVHAHGYFQLFNKVQPALHLPGIFANVVEYQQAVVVQVMVFEHRALFLLRKFSKIDEVFWLCTE